jgi:soluble lytic murein transglycosylase-like protein
MSGKIIAGLIVGSVLAAGARASVLVTLASGGQIEAQAGAVRGDTLVLSVAHGTIELPRAQVARVETVADPAPAKVQPASGTPAAEGASTASLLRAASTAQGLPDAFVSSVARVESGLNPLARSPKGAIGLMQLMPRTAAELGVAADRPPENALGGAMYLRELLLRYQGDTRLALAAYNAGPGAVERFHGVPPYRETVAYIERVLREYQRAQRAGAAKTPSATE